MNKQITPVLLAAGIAVVALVLPTVSHAAAVGYYEMCTGTGGNGHATAITAAGHTPVNVNVPDAATLNTLDVLFVTNCDNFGYGAEYVANLAAIDNAVTNQGLTLIVHDRAVRNAASILPGSAGITFVGGVYGANIDFPASSPILIGPGGALNDSSLDNGTSSTHGYVQSLGVPAGSTALAFEASSTRLATVAYPRGSGRVVFSTIPLDYYFAGNSPAAMINIYAPNLIAWAAGPSFTTCTAEGFTGSKLTLCRQICEIDQSPTRLAGLIKLYMGAYRSEPPCAR